MSDLAATNCGCGNDSGCSNLIWILLILSCCNGNNGTSPLSGGNGCNDLIWLILILNCCCNGGNGNGIF